MRGWDGRVETVNIYYKGTCDWFEDAVLSVCHQFFPTEPALSIHSVSPRLNRFPGHHDFDFICRSPDAEFKVMLRLTQGRLSIWEGIEHEKYQKEYGVMLHAYQAGYPAPFPYGVGVTKRPFGSPYLLMDPGDGSRWWEVNNSLRAVQIEVVDSLADQLALLHQAVSPAHPRVPVIEVGSVLNQLWARVAHLKEDELIRCFEGCWNQCPSISSLPPVLLHGSFDLDHVLIQNGKVRTVIEWEHAAAGDPRWDVAHCSITLQQPRDRFLANRFLARYVQNTGTPMESISFWEGLVALRFYALIRWLRSLDERSFEAVAGRQTNLVAREEEMRARALRQFT